MTRHGRRLHLRIAQADADPGLMIGQIQLVDVPDGLGAIERVWQARDDILAARALTPGLCRRGGGACADVRRLRPATAPCIWPRC